MALVQSLVNELLQPSGSPLTSKRLWALIILCSMACVLYALGMSAADIGGLLEDLAPIGFALVVGESLKDSIFEARRGGRAVPAAIRENAAAP